jgi:hypothetical protein
MLECFWYHRQLLKVGVLPSFCSSSARILLLGDRVWLFSNGNWVAVRYFCPSGDFASTYYIPRPYAFGPGPATLRHIDDVLKAVPSMDTLLFPTSPYVKIACVPFCSDARDAIIVDYSITTTPFLSSRWISLLYRTGRRNGGSAPRRPITLVPSMHSP